MMRSTDLKIREGPWTIGGLEIGFNLHEGNIMLRRTLIVCLPLLLIACGERRGELKLLEETLNQYSSTMRWGTPEQLLAFIDPETLKQRPVREFDLERLRQLRIAGYRADPPVMLDEKRARQVAQVDLVNVNTQEMRDAMEITEWRWDATAERWWLVSGLPDLTRSAR
jgi:hypothetical protein